MKTGFKPVEITKVDPRVTAMQAQASSLARQDWSGGDGWWDTRRAAAPAKDPRISEAMNQWQQRDAQALPQGQAPAGSGTVAPGSTQGSDNYNRGNKDSFIEAMMPHAIKVSQETGLDPRLVIAQAAQETGWGKSAPNNNYFGIKSHGQSGGANLSTREVFNGQSVTVNDSFRQYGGMGDSAQGYASFLKTNPRYRNMLSAPDLNSQLAELGRSGYATDPNYMNSVGSIARNIPLPGQR